MAKKITKKIAKNTPNKTSKDETIGMHKGALSTLVKERIELQRMLMIVEELIKFHAKSLKGLGVDLQAMTKTAKKKSKPIEDMV